jgi:hypothetical protein
MITIPVVYIVGSQTFDRLETFDAPLIRSIEKRGTNESTFRSAINDAAVPRRSVLEAVYRELVLANYARFNGKSGTSAEPALSRAYPDSAALPGFIRTSGRFNAAGMILYNLKVHGSAGEDYRLLASILAALIEGKALQPPRCMIITSEDVSFAFPEEESGASLVEGAVSRVTINAFERSEVARRKCLAYHGYDCVCCGFNFEHCYGRAGRKLIHVHHLIPLASIGASYSVDPVRDLVPVCPNCHSVIHKGTPPYTVAEIKVLLLAAKGLKRK